MDDDFAWENVMVLIGIRIERFQLNRINPSFWELIGEIGKKLLSGYGFGVGFVNEYECSVNESL